jgi:hypothetical protein
MHEIMCTIFMETKDMGPNIIWVNLSNLHNFELFALI